MDGRELQENGTAGLRFYSYEGLGHWFDEKELEDLVIWISTLLPSGEVTLEEVR
jgi:lysophospholipase-2